MHNRPIHALSAIALALTLSSCERRYLVHGRDTWLPGTNRYAVMVGKDVRTFVVHVPAERPRNRIGLAESFPLVILLHGSGADGETIRRQSGFDSLADAYHVIAVYPDGATAVFTYGSDWNAGTCCGTPARDSLNDLGFITQAIDEVAQHAPIDRRRIYVGGFSDGARMAYHVACKDAANIAAIGVVSGSLTDNDCRPSRPVPLVAIHGTADTDVPYADRAMTASRTPLAPGLSSLPPSLGFWAQQDGCTRPFARKISANVTRTGFRGCSADVLFYSINGGQHAWPGGVADGDNGAKPTTELNASRALMLFFLAHSLKN
jgi:polyhydroxybutyrate depolymerase